MSSSCASSISSQGQMDLLPSNSPVSEKVVIWLRPTGNAPILKQSRFKISSGQTFQSIIDFLRKQLQYHNGKEQLFLYINSSFAPAPDESISNLFKCFSVDGMLVINYSITPAWG